MKKENLTKMIDFFKYLIQVSILTLLFFFVYELLFRRESYFKLNRIYLLVSLALAFIIPLLHIPVPGQAIPGFLSGGSLLELTPDTELLSSSRSGGFSGINWWILLYWSGCIWILFQGFRFLFQIQRIRNGHPNIKRGKNRIVVTQNHPSFSFFGWIFLRQDPEAQQSENPILVHELAHARQLHSFDLLLTEIVHALLWFNPIIWLYKKRIREVHEYLADQEVVKSGVQVCDYIRSIQEEIMHNRYNRLASPLKSSTLKKRLIMVMKTNPRRTWWKYLMIVPVVALGISLFSFSTTVVEEKGKKVPTKFPIAKEHIKKIALEHGTEFIDPFTKEKRVHSGIDIAAKTGTPVEAMAKAKVVFAGEKGDHGNLVILMHDEHFSSMYAHLDKIKVKKGMGVQAGDIIGTVGESGKATGPHLHFEVTYDGKSVNPIKAMEKMKIEQSQKDGKVAVKAYQEKKQDEKLIIEKKLKEKLLKEKQLKEKQMKVKKFKEVEQKKKKEAQLKKKKD